MRIIVVSGVFPPEPVVSSRTSFELARALAGRGHDVVVLAPFPNRPAGKLFPGYRRALFRREQIDGVRVVRCGSFFSRRSSIMSRLAENLSFGMTSSLALLFGRRPAVVYANTWPLFAAAMIAATARLRRVPLVLSVQDIYPESLLSQRRRGSGMAARLLLMLDGANARAAAAVVVISEDFSELLRRTRGVDAARVHVVPNWLSAEGTDEVPGAARACRERHGVPHDAFLVVYGGTVGVAAGVETVIEAFRHLAGECDVHLLVAGDGTSVQDCRRCAAEIAPRRIHFDQSWIGTLHVLHAADVLVLPTRAAQSMVSVPSKLINYLLSARAVVAAALPDSETAATIRTSGAGVIVPPDDPRALADAIRAMSRLPREERQRMGLAGRAWAMANVTAEACLPRLIDIVERSAAGQ